MSTGWVVLFIFTTAVVLGGVIAWWLETGAEKWRRR